MLISRSFKASHSDGLCKEDVHGTNKENLRPCSVWTEKGGVKIDKSISNLMKVRHPGVASRSDAAGRQITPSSHDRFDGRE
jgi:hypothetical protein